MKMIMTEPNDGVFLFRMVDETNNMIVVTSFINGMHVEDVKRFIDFVDDKENHDKPSGLVHKAVFDQVLRERLDAREEVEQLRRERDEALAEVKQLQVAIRVAERSSYPPESPLVRRVKKLEGGER